MNNLIYSFRESKVRVLEENGQVWFVAKDVCEILEIGNVSQAVYSLKENYKTTICLTDSGSNYKTQAIAINEPGLYKLVFKSRKPEAEKFSDWVSEEVLPSIRKTGSYQTPILPDTHVKAVEMYLEQLKLVEELKPKAQYTEEVLLSGDSLTITQIAKDLGMTGKELNAKLHALGIQYKQGKQWYLYEKYDGLGYTKAHTYNVEGRTPTMTKWTQKGRKFIIEKLGL